MAGSLEVRAVIASKQGLSCDGYYALSNRTAHLRAQLYVSAYDGDKVFLPKDPHEHFPVTELHEHYLERVRFGLNQSIGAEGGEVVFGCEGPAAEEGATVIERELAGLEPVLIKPLFARWMFAMPEKVRYSMTEQGSARGSLKPAYRPQKLPDRAGVPEALSEDERRGRTRGSATVGEALRELRYLAPREPAPEVSERVEARKREYLKAWGLLEDYDRMKARPRPAKPRPQRQEPWQQTSWREAPWT